MENIILPPSTPRPIEPQRKFKMKAFAKKLLAAALGPDPQLEWSNGRYVRKEQAGVPLKLFIEKLLAEAKALGLDMERVVVRKASQNNSIAIEQHVFTESEEAYLKRYEEYERALEEHTRWESLPTEEKKRMLAEIKKQKKILDLQKKRDALKAELNKIADEIDRAWGNA
jgi:hypothetical protein